MLVPLQTTEFKFCADCKFMEIQPILTEEKKKIGVKVFCNKHKDITSHGACGCPDFIKAIPAKDQLIAIQIIIEEIENNQVPKDCLPEAINRIKAVLENAAT